MRPFSLSASLLALALAVVSGPVVAPSPGRALGVPYQFELTVTGGTVGAFGGVGFAETFVATVTFDPDIAFPENGSNLFLDLNGTLFEQAVSVPETAPLAANKLGGQTPDDPNGFRDYIVRINYDSGTRNVTTPGLPALGISALAADDTTWAATDADGRFLSGSFIVSIVVPEPSTGLLLAIGSGGLSVLCRRRREEPAARASS